MDQEPEPWGPERRCDLPKSTWGTGTGLDRGANFAGVFPSSEEGLEWNRKEEKAEVR